MRRTFFIYLCCCIYSISAIERQGANPVDTNFHTNKACDYRECDCSVLSPKVTIKNVTHLHAGILQVNWIGENFKDSNNMTDIKFSYYLELPAEEIHLYHCDRQIPISNSMLINCSGILSQKENRLFVNFQNVYNCSSELNTTFNVDFDEDNEDAENYTVRSLSSSFSEFPITSSLPVENLTVAVFYNDEYKVIQFNISWQRPKGDFPQYYDFGIIHADNSSGFCDKHYHYETFHNSRFLTNAALPKQPASTVDEVQPGCTYKIWVKSQYYDGQDVPTVICSVPDCVGPICNYCSGVHLHPKAKLLDVELVSANTLNVTWSPDETFGVNRSYTITDIKFVYRKNESYSVHECNHVKDILIDAERDEISSMVQCDGLISKVEYVLIVRFQNNFNCSKSYTKTFIAKEYGAQVEGSRWGKFWIETSILFVIAIILFLTVYSRCQTVVERIKTIFIPHQHQLNSNVEMYAIGTVNAQRAQECYNVIYCESEILDGNVDVFEFPRSRIRIKKLLDSGAFGQVYSADILGKINGKPCPDVAVKTLRDHAPPEEIDDFLSEIDILKKIGEHPNIVTLVGCCTLKQPYFMIMELIPCGSLKSYLLKLRNKWENNKTSSDSVFLDSSADGVYISPDSPRTPSSEASNRFPSITETEYTNLESGESTPLMDTFNHQLEPVLDNKELQNFAFQIAKGMAFLEEKQITHRDLAARNVLINEFKTLKISDFGLSRAGPYINNKSKKLPLRWMAIESIEDHFYNNKSDVWSFGVVLWEIGSLGALPYEKTPDCLILHDLLIGKRLERPEICTDELYTLMLQCWAQDPKMRPPFKEIVELFSVSERKIYADFSHLNPTYVFPPSKLERL